MSEMNSELIKRLASLSRIRVDESEVPRLVSRMSGILQYVEQLMSLDVEEVEPLSHVHDENNFFRDDQVESDEALVKRILDGVPDRSGSFIRTPLVIDQESH